MESGAARPVGGSRYLLRVNAVRACLHIHRRHFSAEDKSRVVLEGLRGEDSTSCTYTDSDGTTVYFDKSLAASNASYGGAFAPAGTVIAHPTGMKTYLA